MSSSIPEIIETPCDLAAERRVLRSLLIQAKLNIPMDMRFFKPEYFYNSNHLRFFSVLQRAAAGYFPTDPMTLSIELEKAKFDEAAEFKTAKEYIDHFVDDLVGSGNLAYDAGILREKANRRAALNASYEIQNLVSADEPLSAIINKIDTLKKSISETPNDYEQHIYIPNWENIPPETPSVLVLNGKKILSPGNLSLVIAGAGSGKSAVCEAICAASIKSETDTFHFCGINVTGLDLLR